jgi:hypothetical protein
MNIEPFEGEDLQPKVIHPKQQAQKHRVWGQTTF